VLSVWAALKVLPLPNPQMGGVASANPHNIVRLRQPKGPVNRFMIVPTSTAPDLDATCRP
jgi:hypothetical protein